MKYAGLKTMMFAVAGLCASCDAPHRTDAEYALDHWVIKPDTLELYASRLDEKDAPMDTFQYLYEQNAKDIQFADARFKTPAWNEHALDGCRYDEFSIFTGRGRDNIETRFTMDYFTLNKNFLDSLGTKRRVNAPKGRGPDYVYFETVLKVIKTPNVKKDSLHVH